MCILPYRLENNRCIVSYRLDIMCVLCHIDWSFMCYLNYRPHPKYISKLCTLALTIKSKFRCPYFSLVFLTIIRPIFLCVCISVLQKDDRAGLETSNKKMVLFRPGAKCLPSLRLFLLSPLLLFIMSLPLTHRSS